MSFWKKKVEEPVFDPTILATPMDFKSLCANTYTVIINFVDNGQTISVEKDNILYVDVDTLGILTITDEDHNEYRFAHGVWLQCTKTKNYP